MNESITEFEKKVWDLFEISEHDMPQLADAYYNGVNEVAYSEGQLSLKHKRLMALGIALHAGCKPCIVSQTERALKLGASVAEIMESCSVAISMGGTLCWSNTLIVVDYLREKGQLGKK